MGASSASTPRQLPQRPHVIRPRVRVSRTFSIVTANVGDADLSAEHIDGIFARWLFCYLPNPAAVLRHVANSLRPGGVVAVIDYWHYLAIRTEPRSPLFDDVFGAVYQSFADAGGSLDVAGALPRYCVDAGLAVRHVEPVSALGRPGSPVWNWIVGLSDPVPRDACRARIPHAESLRTTIWPGGTDLKRHRRRLCSRRRCWPSSR